MELKTFRKFKIPDEPGVYFFLGRPKPGEGGLQKNTILYIGKATSLKSRVRSYFSPDLIKTRGPMTVDMVFKADDLKWETTPSVLEALILEANLIKKYRPYYNIKEKDNKSFLYVVITCEKLPRVLTIRGRELENSAVPDFSSLRPSSGAAGSKRDPRERKIGHGFVFGPYTSGLQLREALRILRKIFPFIDASSSKKQNYQFYKQLGLTPDVSAEANEAYLQNIKYLKLFLSGKKKDIIRGLKKDMMAAARRREFERAEELKRQLFALEHINDVALIKDDSIALQKPANVFRIEAYDIAHMSGKNMTGVMTVVEENEAVKSEYRKFRIRTQENANDTGALAEVLNRRLGHTEWRYPNLIVVDGSTAQINTARKVLETAGVAIPIVSVVKDEHHRPRGISGNMALGREHESAILLANSEAHRFAIAYHKNLRNKSFLGTWKRKKKI